MDNLIKDKTARISRFFLEKYVINHRNMMTRKSFYGIIFHVTGQPFSWEGCILHDEKEL